MNTDHAEVVLTLDIGSSSIRCGAYYVKTGDDLNIVPVENCFASKPLRTVEPNTGKIELTTDWGTSLLDEIDGLIDTTLHILQRNTKPTRVVGIGFASFCMNLVGLNHSGVPVGKEASMSYACSSPSIADECKSLKSLLGPERERDLYQQTGTAIHSSYALPQLRNLYSDPKQSPLLSQIVVWQTLSSICRSRWMGIPFSPISFSEASWTGLFNFRTLQWDMDAIALLPDPCKSHLPEVCDYSDDGFPSHGILSEIKIDNNGPSRNPYWDRWPALRGACTAQTDGVEPCRIFLGLGDGVCANIGSYCSSQDKIAVTIGTSAAARVCVPQTPNASLEEFAVPQGLFCYRLNRSHVVVGGALTDGGSVVEWVRQLVHLQNENDFENCLAQVQELMIQDYQDCHREYLTSPAVSLIPFLSGERSIHYRSGATFCVSGLTRSSTSVHFVKACLEGVILRLNAILQRIRRILDSGSEEPQIVASGSALEKNVLWRQMLADCSGLRVELPIGQRESTSLGVAMLVAVALQRDATAEFAHYLSRHKKDGKSTYSIPLLTSTETYWSVASKNQENLIDALSPFW